MFWLHYNRRWLLALTQAATNRKGDDIEQKNNGRSAHSRLHTDVHFHGKTYKPASRMPPRHWFRKEALRALRGWGTLFQFTPSQRRISGEWIDAHIFASICHNTHCCTCLYTYIYVCMARSSQMALPQSYLRWLCRNHNTETWLFARLLTPAVLEVQGNTTNGIVRGGQAHYATQ